MMIKYHMKNLCYLLKITLKIKMILNLYLLQQAGMNYMKIFLNIYETYMHN